MQQEMYTDKDPKDRETFLQDTCDKVENFSYEKSFTNSDVLLFQERVSEIMIEINKLELDLAKIKKEYTEKLKPLKLEVKELLNNINFRSQTVTEQVYIFLDHENNKVGYYNAEGLLVHTRMLKIDERQRSIMSGIRAEEEETVDAEYEEERY